MQIKIHSQIQQIDATQWNCLITDNNPFMRHEFLSALEVHQCACAKFGWHPCHIGIYSDESEQQLIAAMPLYTKTNSYGEFVFDHAWADAYERNQMAYFPKLVSAIPYTPASGQRMLSVPERRDELFAVLLQVVQQFCQEQKYSGFHCLFANHDEQDWLENNGLMARHDCQFHWHNNHYRDFDDFLAALDKKKRKNIRQERRRVEQQGIRLRVLNGHTASAKDWQDFALFYQLTFMEKYGTATLNEAFFKAVAEQLPDQVLLVLADKPVSSSMSQPVNKAEAQAASSDNYECVAGSLMFISDSTLYGRHWGCREQVDKLHFEACYYQGIEYCIKHQLQRFEPGAQGQHKIARGFIPTLTRSSHWLNQSPFQKSIEDFIGHEKANIDAYMQSLKSPYKPAKESPSSTGTQP